MLLSDLLHKYCFHDSSIKSISYEADHRELTILVYLCNWIQDGYTEDMTEIVLLELRFNNASSVHNAGMFSEAAILSCEVVSESDHSTISIFAELWTDPQSRRDNLQYETLMVKADSVDVTLHPSMKEGSYGHSDL